MGQECSGQIWKYEFFFFEDATLEADCQPLGGGGPGQEQGQVGENTFRGQN